MGAWAGVAHLAHPPRDRERARYRAAVAIRHASHSAGVDPAELSATAYRVFHASLPEELELPSSFEISLLFGGWQRACEQVGVLTHDESEVEAEVVRFLYGPRGAGDMTVRPRVVSPSPGGGDLLISAPRPDPRI